MTNQTKNKMRAEFEAWAKDRGYQRDELDRSTIALVSPEYFNSNTEESWQAWQAACAQAQQSAQSQQDALDAAELEEVQSAISDFEDCGETHVSYDLLMRAANLGYLECTRFATTDDGQAQLDAAIAAQGASNV